MGTITVAILAGQNRYAHVTALRADTVNPRGLGMTAVCEQWQTAALKQSWLPALRQPWIMDSDATVKPIYGR